MRHLENWPKHEYVNDQDDLEHNAKIYKEYTRCSGGRIVHKTYSCAHCGSVDLNECLAPKPTK